MPAPSRQLHHAHQLSIAAWLRWGGARSSTYREISDFRTTRGSSGAARSQTWNQIAPVNSCNKYMRGSAPVSALLLLHGGQQGGVHAAPGRCWSLIRLLLGPCCAGGLGCALVPAHLARPLACGSRRRLFGASCRGMGNGIAMHCSHVALGTDVTIMAEMLSDTGTHQCADSIKTCGHYPGDVCISFHA